MSGENNDPDIPTSRELLYPILAVIRDYGGEATQKQLDRDVPKKAGITEAQLGVVYPSGSRKEGGSKVSDRIGWARSVLKEAGLVEYSRGGPRKITVLGEGILRLPEPEAKKALHEKHKELIRKRIEQKKQDQQLRDSLDIEKDQDKDDITESDVQWKEKLLAKLQELPSSAERGIVLEKLVTRLLVKEGFDDVERTGQSRDGGVDVIGTVKVSLVPFSLYVQCKNYQGVIGPGDVQKFIGALDTHKAERGMLITTSAFSTAAKVAAKNASKPVELVDGDELCDLLEKAGLGVTTRQVTEVDEEFFDDLVE